MSHAECLAEPSDDDLPEIGIAAYEKNDGWRKALESSPIIDRSTLFAAAAADLYGEAYRETNSAAFHAIERDIEILGCDYADLPPETVDKIMADAKVRASIDGTTPQSFKGIRGEEPPPVESLEDYGITPNSAKNFFVRPALSIAEWLSRDLPAPDFILGNWLSTTTRALLVAPTGLGKTNFALALGLHAAAGTDFLHWRGGRPCRVLYIDGEMSRRLFKQRIADAVTRLGSSPTEFYALSHEDVEGFSPLNTAAGQAIIERLIEEIGRPDLIVFDSIMCLVAGDMKDGEAWAQIMPWVRSLTRRCIGQLWVHHTGHDETRSYGDKTKEWQLDTVMHMEPLARDGCDVSFALEFRKARERIPATRADFQTARIALVGDEWTVDAAGVVRAGHVSPLGLKFLDALQNALAGASVEHHKGRRCVSLDLWRAECAAMGLIEIGPPLPPAARSLFSKHRRELIAANRVACDEQRAWTVR
jgi:hypothetical protein